VGKKAALVILAKKTSTGVFPSRSHQERELSLLLLDGRIKGVITEVEGDLDAFKQETIIKLCRKMEEAFHQQSHAAGDLRQETEEILFAALRDVFTVWRRQEIEKLSQKLVDKHCGRLRYDFIPSCAHTGNIFSPFVGADLRVRPQEGAHAGAPLQ